LGTRRDEPLAEGGVMAAEAWAQAEARHDVASWDADNSSRETAEFRFPPGFVAVRPEQQTLGRKAAGFGILTTGSP
jgi:hypothetical protein